MQQLPSKGLSQQKAGMLRVEGAATGKGCQAHPLLSVPEQPCVILPTMNLSHRQEPCQPVQAAQSQFSSRYVPSHPLTSCSAWPHSSSILPGTNGAGDKPESISGITETPRWVCVYPANCAASGRVIVRVQAGLKPSFRAQHLPQPPRPWVKGCGGEPVLSHNWEEQG